MSNYITEQKSYKSSLNQSLSFLEDKMKPIRIILTGLLLALMLSSTSVVFAAWDNGTLAETKYAHCLVPNSSLPMVGNFSGDDIYDPAASLNPTKFALNAEECLSRAASRNSTAGVLVSAQTNSDNFSGDDDYDPATSIFTR